MGGRLRRDLTQRISGDEQLCSGPLRHPRGRGEHQLLQDDLPHSRPKPILELVFDVLEVHDVEPAVLSVAPAPHEVVANHQGVVGYGAVELQVEEVDRAATPHHHPSRYGRVNASREQCQHRALGTEGQTVRTGHGMVHHQGALPMDMDGDSHLGVAQVHTRGVIQKQRSDIDLGVVRTPIVAAVAPDPHRKLLTNDPLPCRLSDEFGQLFAGLELDRLDPFDPVDAEGSRRNLACPNEVDRIEGQLVMACPSYRGGHGCIGEARPQIADQDLYKPITRASRLQVHLAGRDQAHKFAVGVGSGIVHQTSVPANHRSGKQPACAAPSSRFSRAVGGIPYGLIDAGLVLLRL